MKLVQPAADTSVSLPLNLGLNDGTYMPAACVAVMEAQSHALGLRNYGTKGNDQLRAAVARHDSVAPANVLVRNGSGPILKQLLPHLIKRSIMRSPRRIARHLLRRDGFAVLTPSFTYSKVPVKCAEKGIAVHYVPLRPEDDWRLDIAAIAARLEQQDALVYLANPNNPTGNLLATTAQLEPLIKRFPKSWFWVDEAYVQYANERHGRFGALVPRYDNLVVSRTFSFAYGLAGVRVGYALAPAWLVEAMDAQLTGYRLGTLQEALAVAALDDDHHLPWLRELCARERGYLRDVCASTGCMQTWDSETNFVFGRLTDGRTGAWLKGELAERGVLIKAFESAGGEPFAPYFRVTLGTHDENAYFAEQLREVLSDRVSQVRATRSAR